jgi:uncharacterized membrane protein (Fun14 family)
MKSENNFQLVLFESLIKVLREFGIAGVVTYVGGLVILGGFLIETNQHRQILFGVVGVLLLSLSVFIAYFRLKIQRDREQALIDMTKNTGNRLAEQLGKNLSKEQVEAIVQKIRQNQRDLMDKILGSLEER